MQHRLMILAILVLSLTGCGVSRLLADSDEETCEKYGFTPGTDAFAACVQRESFHRDQQSRPAG